MRKKFIILGLILLFTGGGMLGWVLFEERKEQQDIAKYKLKYSSETDDYIKQYDQWLQLPPEERTQLPLVLDKNGKTKTKSELHKEQQERLKADMDRLAAGEMADYPFAEDFYGSNWREEVSKYKQRQELNEFIFTGSIVCASMGAVIIVWYVVLWMVRIIIWIPIAIGRFFSEHLQSEEEEEEKEEEEEEEKEEEDNDYDEKDEEKKKEHLEIISSVENTPLIVGRKTKIDEKRLNQLTKSELISDSKDSKRLEKDPIKIQSTKNDNHTEDPEESKPDQKQENFVAKRKVLPLSNKKNVELEAPVKSETKCTNVTEKQIPIDNTLEELTEQVSAIREYTAFQQNRLEKLQDGYDWNIIRTFCLRIIRCIDNLDTRISQLSDLDMDATHLKEVRDELVFALESSGVEQFEPEINSDYRGQEKFAEVIKSKQRCNDPKLAGKIANIIKPGYHYLINDENVKVIRPAQVRLFA